MARDLVLLHRRAPRCLHQYPELPSFSLVQNYAYLSLYIACYVLDDTIMVAIAAVTLPHRKMQESQGRWLKLISGSVVLAIGLVMLFKPAWPQYL